MIDFSSIRQLALIGICLIGISANALAADAKRYTLFTNINVYNGLEYRLYENLKVLVKDNQIVKIGESLDAPAGATVIDGGGRTLMPGMIDTHTFSACGCRTPTGKSVGTGNCDQNGADRLG